MTSVLYECSVMDGYIDILVEESNYSLIRDNSDKEINCLSATRSTH